MLAFSSTLDGVRFCHATQVTILYTQWPPEAAEVFGAVEYTPDGRLIHRGPRFAMAIHSSEQWGCVPLVHGAMPLAMCSCGHFASAWVSVYPQQAGIDIWHFA